MSSTRTAVIALAVLGLTLGAVGQIIISVEEPEVTPQDLPERLAVLEVVQAPVPMEPASPLEEGKVGKKDARMEVATGSQTEAKPAAAAEKNREAAESAGVLGVLSAEAPLDGVFGSSTLNSDLTGGIGGLIGAKRIQTGSGGLGSRGSGLGGGGIADSLGGLGTKGRGSGASGYGSGGGSFGAGRAAVEQQSSREGYTNYGINAQTLVESDHLSTFSIDVDTASYTIARSKLLTGQLPPESAVRVEEFVNYFNYRYADRADDAPFAVFMEAAPSPWEPNHHVLRVGLQGDRIDEDDRKPVRLTFLVDVSGSMSANNKLPLARKAMQHLVSNLGPEDSVAITTYAGRTEILLMPTAASDLSTINAAIDTLQSGGGTNMDSGVQLAYQLADQAFVAGAENRVVVLSDGDANIGRTSHESLLTEITGYAKKGITLSTIGFGRGNYQDTLMEQLANKGDGNYFYIDDYTEAKKVFGQDLSGTIQTIARDVKIQVDFDPDVVLSYRLIGYENRDIADADFRNDAVDAGEIGSGHSVTALYDVILRDGYRDHAGSLATVRLRAKPPGADAAAEEWFTAYPAGDVRDEMAETTDGFRLALGAATFAEKLRGSHYVAELSYEQIAALVGGAKRDGVAIEDELENLVRQAGTLAGESGVATR
ncbi:MAG: Ca-activated chloride channel family protein [Myxococcota bacterium]|jgi:Ca-activated chloride channel family protein